MAKAKGNTGGGRMGCVPCYYILRYMCINGNDEDLCKAYLQYANTGSMKAIELAYNVASPDLIEKAKEHVVALGIAQRA